MRQVARSSPAPHFKPTGKGKELTQQVSVNQIALLHHKQGLMLTLDTSLVADHQVPLMPAQTVILLGTKPLDKAQIMMTPF